jgi:hypothetical protein
MDGVADYVRVAIAPNQLESEVIRVCLVDQDFCMKAIDFDIAIRVKDEDEEVDDQCGTRHWMVPGVEKKSRYVLLRLTDGHAGMFFCTCLTSSGKETNP